MPGIERDFIPPWQITTMVTCSYSITSCLGCDLSTALRTVFCVKMICGVKQSAQIWAAACPIGQQVIEPSRLHRGTTLLVPLMFPADFAATYAATAADRFSAFVRRRPTQRNDEVFLARTIYTTIAVAVLLFLGKVNSLQLAPSPRVATRLF